MKNELTWENVSVKDTKNKEPIYDSNNQLIGYGEEIMEPHEHNHNIKEDLDAQFRQEHCSNCEGVDYCEDLTYCMEERNNEPKKRIN